MGGEHIVVVEAGGAAVLHQLAHAGEGGETDDVLVQIFPDLVEGFEPVEQLHILHLREVAGEHLIQVVVGVHQTGVAQHMVGVDGSVGGNVQMGADLTDEAVLAVEVHVLQQLVLIVAGHQIADAADQQACHRSLLLSEEYPPKDRGIFGRFTGLPGSSSGPERWGADPPAFSAGTR